MAADREQGLLAHIEILTARCHQRRRAAGAGIWSKLISLVISHFSKLVMTLEGAEVIGVQTAKLWERA
jgi:hypothetical protein